MDMVFYRRILRSVFFMGGMLAVWACGPHSGGGDLALIPVSDGKAWGYINHRGEYVIPPQFESAGCFADGLARVGVKGPGGNMLFGFVDKKGTFIVPADFREISDFSGGIAWTVRENCAPAAIGTRGEELFVFKEGRWVYPFSEGLAKFMDDNYRFGFLDKKGKIVIPAQFYRAGNFSRGKAPVKKDEEGAYGYIDEKGNWMISPQFEMAFPFDDNGKAAVKIPGGKCGIINEKGLFVVNPVFPQIWYDNGLYMIRDEAGRFGWCNEKGAVVIPPQYRYAAVFGTGPLACVEIEGKWGYIDKKGNIVIQPQFSQGNLFFDGISLAVPEGGSEFGIIDEKGRYVVNPSFRAVNVASMVRVLSPAFANLDLSPSGVRNDYIDTAKIAGALKAKIDFTEFFGLRYDEMLSSVCTRLRLQDRDFSADRIYQPVVKGTLCGDIEFTVSIRGDFFRKVSDGWWGYKTELNAMTVPKRFRCSLALSGLPAQKSGLVFEGICNAYGTERKGPAEAVVRRGEGELYFSLDHHTIIVEMSPGLSN